MDEEEVHNYLTDAFSADKQQGQNYVTRERFMKVLKDLPGFDLTDKELTTIMAICKHDQEGEEGGQQRMNEINLT